MSAIYLAYYSDKYSASAKILGVYESIEDARNILLKDIGEYFEQDFNRDEIKKELLQFDCYEPDDDVTWKVEKCIVIPKTKNR